MDHLVNTFCAPDPWYSVAPFWFWNGDLDPDELVRQIHLMYKQGIRVFMIHARLGLEVEYLSEAWFDRCRVAVEEAARLGMKVWFYDEDNWPSGYAGGRVLARDENFAGQNLVVERHYIEGPSAFHLELAKADKVRAVAGVRIAETQTIPPNPLAFNKEGEVATPWHDRTTHIHTYAQEQPRPLPIEHGRVAWDVPAGYWCVMVMRQERTDWFPAYSETYYVDLANGRATEAFIEETHEQYYQRFKEHFGSTILGFFVDEPGFYNNFWDRNLGSITWTHDMAQEFERRRGYSLMPWLPCLWEDLGERGMQVRYDYWLTVSELIQERFFEKLADWCVAHGVMLTGHLHWEEWLFEVTRTAGSPFMALKPFHVPGVDRIDEVYEKMSEKLVSSVAHAHGKPRVLSETFALTGWKLAPPYMKRIIDYQYVRGINMLNPHAFFYSTEGFRQRECPPSQFFQNPWWEHSKPLWDYVARLSAILSQGAHVAPIALYYPSEQAWATMMPDAPHSFDGSAWAAWQLPEKHLPVLQTDLSLFNLAHRLLENQLDFDLVDQSVIESAKTDGGKLQVADEQFAAVVVPKVDVLTASTLERLLTLARAGGVVVFANNLPGVVLNGDVPEAWDRLHEELAALELPGLVAHGAGKVGFVPQGSESLVRLLRQVVAPDLELTVDEEDDHLVWQEEYTGSGRQVTIRPLRYALKYHKRLVEGAHVYFIVNESGRPFNAHLQLVGGPLAEQWKLTDGERLSLPSERTKDGRTALDLVFGPWESHIVVLSDGDPQEPKPVQITATHRLSDWEYEVGGHCFEGELLSWHELGLACYSGQGIYRTTFEFPYRPHAQQHVLIDLGSLLETAQITINGCVLAPLAWAPYVADITECVHPGENHLEVTVANTNANAYEGQERPSGLLGPVYLIMAE